MRDEGLRLVAYDDKTGKPVPPGGKCIGKLTIGVGRNLDGNPFKPSEIAMVGHDGRTKPITQQQAFFLLNNDIDDTIRVIRATWAWADGLDEPRGRALLELVFNMGIAKVLTFKRFLAAMQAGAWQSAAEELSSSLWDHQVGARADRIESLIELGKTIA